MMPLGTRAAGQWREKLFDRTIAKASRECDIRAVALFCLDPVVDSASCKLFIIQDGPRFIQAKQFFRLKEEDAVPTTLYNPIQPYTTKGVAATSHAPTFRVPLAAGVRAAVRLFGVSGAVPGTYGCPLSVARSRSL
jgi:hypothetical protein